MAVLCEPCGQLLETELLPVWLAELPGVLAGVALGRPFALPLTLAGVVPLAFLRGLLLTLLAALPLLLLLRPRLGRGGWRLKRSAS